MRPLAVIGNVNVDLILGPVTPWPVPGTEVIVDHDTLRPGGAAGNTALAWAGLNVPFLLAANVGADAFGKWLSDAFAPHSARWTKSSGNTTISVGLTHPGDERTFFTTRGHLADLGWTDIAGQLGTMQGGILLLCGCFLMDKLTQDYPAIFDWAISQGVDIALDPGWPPDGWTPERTRTTDWLRHTRYLLVNEIEALSLTNTQSLDAALSALARLMPPDGTVVIKAGSSGAVGLCGAIQAQAAAPAVAVIDTIGAGDIFNAGYLLAVAEGQDLSAALRAGVDLASRAISTAPRCYQRAPEQAGVV